RLWLRPLDSLSTRPLQGTEGAAHPFWSPDNKYVGFFADGKLKRGDVLGGAPQILCPTPITTVYSVQGGTWNRDGIVLFGGEEGLSRVPASGGVPQRVTRIDTGRRELGHGLPQFLPDGKRFLYFIQSNDPSVQGVYAASLDAPQESRRILA